MLNKLIKKFEELKSIKIQKFANNSDIALANSNTFNKVSKLLERYEYDVFALCDLEPFFVINNHHVKNKESYIGMLVSYLLYYKDNDQEKLDKDTEYKIRNDEKVIEAIVDLEQRLKNGLIGSINYEPVQKELEEIQAIIDALKSINSEDYIDQKTIKMIYDYLLKEIYISYYDKYVEIGRLIGEHNIDVSIKRTSI